MGGKIGQDMSSEDLKDEQKESRGFTEASYGLEDEELKRRVSLDDEESYSFGELSDYLKPLVLGGAALYAGYRMGTEGVSYDEMFPVYGRYLEESAYGLLCDPQVSHLCMGNAEKMLESSGEAIDVFSTIL